MFEEIGVLQGGIIGKERLVEAEEEPGGAKSFRGF